LSSIAAATTNEVAAAAPQPSGLSRANALIERFQVVRDFTSSLAAGLAPEDCVVQSMPDVSPAKWHLAHTTWFFETFIVKKWVSGYRSAVPEYAYLFNSYYNAAGDMHRRDLRGLISRPTVEETHRYRGSIDEYVRQLLADANNELLDELAPLIELGIHHEQQHQELFVTDIKHVFAQNPLYPVFRSRDQSAGEVKPIEFIEFGKAMVLIGHAGPSFSYDNEGPQHQTLVGPFSLASRPVTNGEFRAFIEAGGYSRPEYWLSLGWTTVNEQRWSAPLYWTKRDGAWWHYTLAGFREVNDSEPVTHLSYFEADAYANWAGARLPTEFEWEHASAPCAIEGNFVDTGAFHPQPSAAMSANENLSPSLTRPRPSDGAGHLLDVGKITLQQMFGDVWEWTRSSYSPYPGYRAAPGALGEYNGKFMCNQYVLRGGSCATSRTHIRRTYRNFFQPEKRWQFTGLRLAKDPS
jgi:ergothioneine biosynthesis protein EgtB